ncbi:C-X-C chemokine receptor type 5 [Trichomycterus rosablanca]|uniref:C-X-C chemokine receptor type 5 n=1 Tax=Trichomycterus rosablanca TaxID=2290929 RepID=UPI002F351E33
MENYSVENAQSVSGSRHTSASKCSVAGGPARARAVAKAAHARAAFAQQELEIKKQKARLALEKASLEASLQALGLEKTAAAANAEPKVLEAAAEMECEDMLSPRSGVTPLEVQQWTETYVEQLAQNLQEKWLSAGSRYKEHHKVCFPPFSFFADFVRGEAKARNDPSFILTNNNHGHHRNERAAGRHEGTRTAISVHKTDVAAKADEREKENELFTDFTADYENVSYIYPDGDYTCDGEEESMHLYNTVLQPLFYSMVFLLGLIGNGVLLMVLLQRRAHLRMTEIYLLHLAVADLLLLFTLPFAITQLLTSWVFGNFMCKLIGMLNYLNQLCGSLLLAFISFDRYLAIVHAISSLHTRRPQCVHLICALLWLFCMGISMPNMVFLSVAPSRNDSNNIQCFFNNHGIHAHHWLLISRLLTNLLCFFLPMVIMSYCYITIVITLYHSQQSLEKQGAIRLAIVVTLVFCLFWLPFNITLFVDTLIRLDIVTQTTCLARSTLAQGLLVTQSIGVIHCCLNPILYAFVGVRFRKDLLRFLTKHVPFCGSALCGRWFRSMSVSEMATSTTSTQYI